MRSAHVYGSAVFDRMRWAESLLAVAATSSSPPPVSSARIGHELDGFVVFDRRDGWWRRAARRRRCHNRSACRRTSPGIGRAARAADLAIETGKGGRPRLHGERGDQVGMIAVTLSAGLPVGGAGRRGAGHALLRPDAFRCAPVLFRPDAGRGAAAAHRDGAARRATGQFTTDQTAMRAGGAVIDTSAHFAGPTS